MDLEALPNAALPNRIGLVAGTGDFPVLITRAARAKGIGVVAFCLKDHENGELRDTAESFHTVSLSNISAMLELARGAGLGHFVLAGRIPHEVLLNPLLLLDGRIRRILGNLANRKADTVLGAFTRELESEGFSVLDSTLFVTSLMPAPGFLTRGPAPSEDQMRDFEFGYRTAKGIAALDIGQAVAVKQGVVIAVEALEGTDRMIERAGELAGPGVTIVKVSKPAQTMKFDVPIIGLRTVENLVRIGATGLAVTARKSLFFDQAEALALAERHGITLYAREESPAPGTTPPPP
ncbi:MAG: UDP-2,3-diacylglucosamine diphosphatase LpxI [Candidatus Sumerlaeia bacterium]|nr:UDP-2,3-diacylglucosamine diphosphatase LpxI [Candidatus Sumerlaeia bacterium]